MPSWIDADDERCENTQTEKNKTARRRRFRLHLAGPCSPSGAAAAVIIIVITRRTSERRSHSALSVAWSLQLRLRRPTTTTNPGRLIRKLRGGFVSRVVSD